MLPSYHPMRGAPMLPSYHPMTLERAVSHLLLAEPIVSHLLLAEDAGDVRHPPMADFEDDDDDDGDEAEAEAEAEGDEGDEGGPAPSSTQLGDAPPEHVMSTKRLLRQKTTKLARRHSSTCATLSVRCKPNPKPNLTPNPNPNPNPSPNALRQAQERLEAPRPGCGRSQDKGVGRRLGARACG
eukprot:scaffold20828_cov47-Phaeocystis_antarctica.AAC.2